MRLSAEICSRIVAYIPSSRHKDLRSLLYTNRAFHVAAQPKFYSHLSFMGIAATRFTFTINHVAPHLAAYIRTFGVISSRPAGKFGGVLGPYFWEGVRNAMKKMRNLETLIFDCVPEPCFTYFLDLDGTEWPFKLQQIELHLVLDPHVQNFLNKQADAGCLRIVQFLPHGICLDKDKEVVLPTVDLLKTKFSLATYIQAPSVIYLQLTFDHHTPITVKEDTYISITLSKFPLLRSLSILDLPALLSAPTLAHLVSSLPTLTDNLLYLSHFHLPEPYPAHSRERRLFFASLLRFRRLQTLEVSLDTWHLDFLVPLNRTTATSRGRGEIRLFPNIGAEINTDLHPSRAVQRGIITELATVCPTLRTVVLWYRGAGVKWSFIEANDGLLVRMGDHNLHERDVEEAIAVACGGGGGGGGSGSCNTGGRSIRVEHIPPKIKNSAKVGSWQFCGEATQCPGQSNLWFSGYIESVHPLTDIPIY